MQTNITYYAVLLMLTRSIGCVVADYVVQVHLQSYSNPTNRAQSQSGACCDNRQAEVCNGTHRCDNYFSFCFRPVDTPAQERVCDETTRIVSAFAANNDAFINFDQPTILGRPNPLNLSVSGPLQDIQLYIEVYDRDYALNNQDDFIDSFAVNVYKSAGTSLVNTLGTYGYGMFSLNALTLCAQFFSGDQCQYVDKCQRDSITCSGHGSCITTMNTYICVCDPGYTGADCEVNINECEHQRCSKNGRCIDDVNMYNCVCDPGFTGTDCETEINECDYQNCSGHGQCTDKVNSYSCDCLVGFLGNNCEHIDHCFGVNCSGNGRCELRGNGFTCNCTIEFTGELCKEVMQSESLIEVIAGGITAAVFMMILITVLLILLIVYLTRKRETTSVQVSHENGPTNYGSRESVSEAEFDNPIYGDSNFDKTNDEPLGSQESNAYETPVAMYATVKS